MHGEQALLDAGAEFVAVWPQELVAHLQPGGFASAVCALSAPPTCSCGETHDGGAGRAGGDGDLAAAGRLRRERSRASASALAIRLGASDPPTSPVVERAEAAREVDATLLRSLARLRAAPFPASTASVLSV
jgi:phosphoglycolate phosphatase